MNDEESPQIGTDAQRVRQDADAKIRELEARAAEADARRLSKRGAGLLLLSIAAIVVTWQSTFGQMWARWYPAWRIDHLSLLDRLTEGDSYYTHGPLVPLTSLLIAIFIYRRVGLPVNRSRGASVLGWVIFIGSILLQLVSAKAQSVSFSSGFALVGVLGGLALAWGGWPLARAYWLPIVLLVFMVPMPMGAIAGINFKLKFLASEMALWATTNVFGITAYLDGSKVHLPNAPDGTPKTLIVENVCSGLRSLISLTFFATLFAAVCRVTGGWRLLLLVLAVPVAIVTNVIRITVLNLVAHHHSVEAAGPDSGFHDLSGVLVFVVALAILFGIEQVIILTGKLLGRKWVDHRLFGFLEKLRHVDRNQPLGVGLATAGVLVITAALTVAATHAAANTKTDFGKHAAEAVPQQLILGDTALDSVSLELDEKTLTILQTTDYVYRRYGEYEKEVYLLIVFSSNNRKGTHEPEVCLEGAGSQIVSKQLHEVELPGVGDVTLRELVSQRNRSRLMHVYVYKAGNVYTPSFLRQQFTIFVNGLLRSNSSGALIRFDVPVKGENTAQARKSALAAVAQLMPEIDRNLP